MAFIHVLYLKNTVINSDDYKKLEAKNERLKEQLDREIHINRIMKRALKDISEQFDKIDFGDFEENFICKTSRIALKQIEEME